MVATEGDFIFGFTANSLDKRNRLIYAARITKKLPNGDYYKKGKYAFRDDCIYWYQKLASVDGRMRSITIVRRI